MNTSQMEFNMKGQYENWATYGLWAVLPQSLKILNEKQIDLILPESPWNYSSKLHKNSYPHPLWILNKQSKIIVQEVQPESE